MSKMKELWAKMRQDKIDRGVCETWFKQKEIDAAQTSREKATSSGLAALAGIASSGTLGSITGINISPGSTISSPSSGTTSLWTTPPTTTSSASGININHVYINQGTVYLRFSGYSSFINLRTGQIEYDVDGRASTRVQEFDVTQLNTVLGKLFE
jgi:hypothetical protein